MLLKIGRKGTRGSSLPGVNGVLTHQRTSRFSSNDAESSSARKASIVRRELVLEDVRDDAHVRVGVERDVDMRLRHEVDRGRVARRAAHGHGDGLGAGREQAERRRRDGSRRVLAVAEEAPRPLPPPDPRGRKARELGARSSRRDVIRLTYVSSSSSPSGAQSSASWPTSATCSSPHAQANDDAEHGGVRGARAAARSRGTTTGARVVEPAAGQASRYVPVRASTPPMV